MSKEKFPRCYFCKRELAEGNKLTTPVSGRTVYLCLDCTDVIGAIAHDLSGVVTDLAHIMSDPTETWKERLELWQLED